MCHQRQLPKTAMFQWTVLDVWGRICSLKGGKGGAIRQNRKQTHRRGLSKLEWEEGKKAMEG